MPRPNTTLPAGRHRRPLPKSSGSHTRKLSVERLESRHLLAVVTWDGGGDAVSWSDRLNWSTDELPGAEDDAVIDVAQNPQVVFGGTSQSIRSLYSEEALRLSGGTLQV